MTYIVLILSLLAASAATTAAHDKNKTKLAIYGAITAASAFVVATALGG